MPPDAAGGAAPRCGLWKRLCVERQHGACSAQEPALRSMVSGEHGMVQRLKLERILGGDGSGHNGCAHDGPASACTMVLHRPPTHLHSTHQRACRCVNTVAFTPEGDFLLSGSDDLNVILWNWRTGGCGPPRGSAAAHAAPGPPQRGSAERAHTPRLRRRRAGKPVATFETNHLNNIFQARALPFTNNRTIVTCAADGQVHGRPH